VSLDVMAKTGKQTNPVYPGYGKVNSVYYEGIEKLSVIIM